MPSAPSSLNLFLLSGLLIAWLTPISAWWTLRGEKDRNAQIWFLGSAIYALAVTAFVLGPSEIVYSRHAIVQFLALASVLCTYEALRGELGRTQAPVIKYFGLIIFEQIVLAICEFFGGFNSYGMAFHHITISFIEIIMMFVCLKLHKTVKSRSILVVMIVLIFLLSANIGRVFIFTTTGIYPNLKDPDFISRYSLMVIYLSLIFFCYGYWGFVGEKYRFNLTKAVQASLEVEAREVKAQEEKLLVEKLLKERMAITDGLISLAQNIQSGAIASSIVHELTQPLAALKLEIDQLSDGVGRSADFIGFQEKINKIQLDLERLVRVTAKTREVFSLSEPTLTLGAVDSLLLGCLQKNLLRRPVTGIVIKKEFGMSALIKVSFEELELAFSNLFDNALKALSQVPPERRTLHLKTWQAQDVGFISILDTGEGVPLQIRDRMFEISVSNDKGSMGLGLWLSRYVIERNGGQISFNELNTMGAEFIIQFSIVKTQHDKN